MTRLKVSLISLFIGTFTSGYALVVRAQSPLNLQSMSDTPRASNSKEECGQTIGLLKLKLDRLTAHARNATKNFTGDEAQAVLAQKRIETAIEDFVQDAKNWRTTWDFFNKSRDDENLKEMTKRVTRELSTALMGTQVELNGRPQRSANHGNSAFEFHYDIRYPTLDPKLAQDSALLSIDGANLRAKFVSVRDGTPAAKFSFLAGLGAAAADPVLPDDKAYSAGLGAAIKALRKSCDFAPPAH